MSQIIVTVKPSGEAVVEAEGIKGSQCSLHTRPYILALGQQTKSSPKSEMFEQPITQHHEITQ